MAKVEPNIAGDSGRHVHSGSHPDWARVVSQDGRSIDWRCGLPFCGARFPNKDRLMKHRIKIHNMTVEDGSIPSQQQKERLTQNPGEKLRKDPGKKKGGRKLDVHGKKELGLDHENNTHEEVKRHELERQNASKEDNGGEREGSPIRYSIEGGDPTKNPESLQVLKKRPYLTITEAPKGLEEASTSQNPSLDIVLSAQDSMIGRTQIAEIPELLESRHCSNKKQVNGDGGQIFISQYKQQFECFKESLSASKNFVKEFERQKKDVAKWKKKKEVTQQKLDRLQHELKQLQETNVRCSEIAQKYLKVQEEHCTTVEEMISTYSTVLRGIRLCVDVGKPLAEFKREKEMVESKEDQYFLTKLDTCKEAAEMARVKADTILEGLHTRLSQMQDLSQTADRAKTGAEMGNYSLFEGVHACVLQMEKMSHEKIRVAEAEHKMLCEQLELLGKM